MNYEEMMKVLIDAEAVIIARLLRNLSGDQNNLIALTRAIFRRKECRILIEWIK
jgi:ABC-type sugar transport system ATPase subunit